MQALASLDNAGTDVTAPYLAVELDLVSCRIGLLPGVSERVAHGGDAEHPTSSGHEAIAFAPRAGVVDTDPWQRFGLVDASAAVPGLFGRYFPDIGPKYAKGPNPPAPGDLAFTEFVVFGS